ncbi:hypothetical protein Acr_21g0002680 [Actinidia rufa]|uniref:Uncharacterized protein n=1 Tax=Actinidia rufa TaxID=165716 RepID=A0A7J0GFT6_9ERIC|nr:hypothetical protein Acr_21g0002680 [Actinidia rufa]
MGYSIFHRSVCTFTPKCLHLHTEVPAPSHRGALYPPLGCLTPSAVVYRKVCHFASCRGSISPHLCGQLERSPPLIKSRAKEIRFGVAAPFAVQLLKSTCSPSSKLLYGHPALVAPLVSGQTFAHIPKQIPALLYCSRSSKCHYRYPKYPYAYFVYLYAMVAFLFHSSR